MKRTIYLYLMLVVIATIISCADDTEIYPPRNDTTQSLTIYVTDEHGNAVSAHGRLMKGDRTITEFEVSNNTNTFKLPGEEGVSIVIEKDGFERAVTPLDQKTLYTLRGNILRVVLKSILAITINTYEDDDVYVIDLDGNGSITIIWPDGTIEKAEMPLSFSREFDKGMNEPIILKGDINGITTFRAFGYNTAISNIFGLRNMTDLKDFFPGNVALSQQLDLTQNRNLAAIDLFNATLPRWIKLPEHHYINTFTLSLTDRNITSSEVSRLITNLYKNSTKRNIRGGTIALTGSDMATPHTLAQIAILENKYGWNVELNL